MNNPKGSTDASVNDNNTNNVVNSSNNTKIPKNSNGSGPYNSFNAILKQIPKASPKKFEDFKKRAYGSLW